jgi:hypothetical protein
MTMAAILSGVRWLGGGLVDIFHKFLPPERLRALAMFALVGVIAWSWCYIHYDVRGLKNDRAAYAALKTANAQGDREAREQQKRDQDLAYKAGYDAGRSFELIVTISKPTFLEIPHVVSQEADAACPVPWGFVRLWDAFSTGADLDSVRTRVAPGQPDDAKSDVTLSEIATLFGTAAERFHLNADKLNRLQAFERGAGK